MIVGTGTIKINELNSMDDVIRRMLKLTNSSDVIINNRINEMKSIESQNRDLLEEIDDENLKEVLDDKSNTKLISDIKSQYVITNVMSTIASIADKNQKIYCIIFLLKKDYHIKFPSSFVLPEIQTEYAYINTDNAEINEKVQKIYKMIEKKSDAMDAIKDSYRLKGNPEIVDFLFENHPDKDFWTFQTSNFYRDCRRKFGEDFSKEQKIILGDFLSAFKKMHKKISATGEKSYYSIFNVKQEDYVENIASAIKPLIEMNALNLLS